MSDTPGDMAAKLEGMFVRFATETEDDAARRRQATARAAASMLRECAEREKALQAEVARLSKPEWFYSVEDPECTYGDISDVAGNIGGSEVDYVGGAREVCQIYVTHRCLSLDDKGDPDDFEVATFQKNEGDKAAACWDESVAALRAAAKALEPK